MIIIPCPVIFSLWRKFIAVKSDVFFMYWLLLFLSQPRQIRKEYIEDISTGRWKKMILFTYSTASFIFFLKLPALVFYKIIKKTCIF